MSAIKCPVSFNTAPVSIDSNYPLRLSIPEFENHQRKGDGAAGVLGEHSLLPEVELIESLL